jgi:hypothetical protein
LNETKLRAEVERRRNVTDKAWELLKDLEFVAYAEEEIGEAKDAPIAYLVAWLNAIDDAGQPRDGVSRPGGRTASGEKAPAQLSDYEIEKSELFSEYLAKQAVSDYFLVQDEADPSKDRRISSEVTDFRVKYLDDKLLSPQQAWTLLASPVTAHWPRLAFQVLRVPVVGHTYEVREGLSDERGPYSLVEVPLPSPKVESFKDRRPLKPGPWQIPHQPESARSNRKPKRELEAPGGSWKILTFPGEDGYPHRVFTRPRSVLGDLHDKVSRLIKQYPWEEPDAVWFVLTGETPWVAPLTWQFRGTGSGPDSWMYGYITLKVEPWVSASVVERVYSDLQHKLLGKDNRRVGEKNRELFRFVTEHRNSDGSLPKARELVKEWDYVYPQWRYGHADTEQVRRFRRDYNLARRLLTAPNYELPDE